MPEEISAEAKHGNGFVENVGIKLGGQLQCRRRNVGDLVQIRHSKSRFWLSRR